MPDIFGRTLVRVEGKVCQAGRRYLDIPVAKKIIRNKMGDILATNYLSRQYPLLSSFYKCSLGSYFLGVLSFNKDNAIRSEINTAFDYNYNECFGIFCIC